MSSLNFYSDCPEIEPVRRIYGIESELEINPYEQPIYELFEGRRMTKKLGTIQQFSQNGSRIYVDSGNHPEYATPECQTIRETVAAVIAGEIIMSEIVDLHGGKLEQQHFRLNNRVIGDDPKISWGVHENYQTLKRINPEKSESWDGYSDHWNGLITHLSTRMILSGAGHVERRTGKYFVAQKAQHVKTPISSTTTSSISKPHINTRDESFSSNNNFRRLHIVSGDPNMIPWSSAYKIASTSLVLRMMEHGVNMNDLKLYRPANVTVSVAKDNKLSKLVELDSGVKIRSAEVQLALAELALEFIETVSVPEDEKIMANEWYAAAEHLVDSPKDKEFLKNKVDWIAKDHIIKSAKSRTGSTTDYVHARAIDRMWGDLNYNGIAIKLRKLGHFDDPLDAISLAPHLIKNPPKGRAELRGELIRCLRNVVPKRSIRVRSVNWNEVKYNFEGGDREVYLNDSYGENPDEIARLYRHIEELE